MHGSSGDTGCATNAEVRVVSTSGGDENESGVGYECGRPDDTEEEVEGRGDCTGAGRLRGVVRAEVLVRRGGGMRVG